MELKLRLGGVIFHFCSERDLVINQELYPFVVNDTEKEDTTIFVSWDWDHVRSPQTKMAGQDTILNYYRDENINYCIARSGPKGPIACTSYSCNFETVVCTINEQPFLQPPKALGSILRMLPIREIFLYFHTIFLHASQIAYKGKGILFTAPSETGKSTQAKLWKEFRNAEIVCNDRTLLRKSNANWFTYGYPIDGSEPIRSSQINPLGCVVVLKQGTMNGVGKLRPAKAISLLMRQVVLDCWNGSSKTGNMKLLVELLQDIPVYLLTCTPDERAVQVLETKLIEDEVIPNG